jgi:hypothetical protein
MKLQQIAPKWHRRIKKGYLTPSQVGLLSDTTKCVVGEAYGGKNSYAYNTELAGHPDYCQQCNEYGCIFYEIMTDELLKFAKAERFDNVVKLIGVSRSTRIPVTKFFKMAVTDLERHWCKEHSH